MSLNHRHTQAGCALMYEVQCRGRNRYRTVAALSECLGFVLCFRCLPVRGRRVQPYHNSSFGDDERSECIKFFRCRSVRSGHPGLFPSIIAWKKRSFTPGESWLSFLVNCFTYSRFVFPSTGHGFLQTGR